VVASAFYYVVGVLDKDRLLRRSAFSAFVLFGVLTAALVWRLL
jgi:hypothetical protein